MAADFGHLTEQTEDGRSIAVATAADVHLVPTIEKHEVTVFANTTADENLTVKIDGETTGIEETVTARKTRVIWTGVIDNTAAGTAAINVDSDGTTARVWGKFRKL